MGEEEAVAVARDEATVQAERPIDLVLMRCAKTNVGARYDDDVVVGSEDVVWSCVHPLRHPFPVTAALLAHSAASNRVASDEFPGSRRLVAASAAESTKHP